jgi:group I intron endonuclease
MIGIYLITNIVNKKLYIGSSQDIKRRFYLHKYHLNKGNHTNQHLQNAWNEYGKDNFSFSILEQINNTEQLLEKEKAYILEHNSINREFGYNICEDTMAPMTGRKHTEISKQKMIKSKLGDSNSFYGKHHTDETKAILREQMKGRKLDKSHKEKVLKTGYQSGETNINAKLTISLANEIRKEYNESKIKRGLFKQLAERYAVHYTTIRRIIKNISYKNGEFNVD